MRRGRPPVEDRTAADADRDPTPVQISSLDQSRAGCSSGVDGDGEEQRRSRRSRRRRPAVAAGRRRPMPSSDTRRQHEHRAADGHAADQPPQPRSGRDARAGRGCRRARRTRRSPTAKPPIVQNRVQRVVGEVEQHVGGDEQHHRDAHRGDDLEQRRADGRAARRSRRGTRYPTATSEPHAARRCRAEADSRPATRSAAPPSTSSDVTRRPARASRRRRECCQIVRTGRWFTVLAPSADRATVRNSSETRAGRRPPLVAGGRRSLGRSDAAQLAARPPRCCRRPPGRSSSPLTNAVALAQNAACDLGRHRSDASKPAGSAVCRISRNPCSSGVHSDVSTPVRRR